MPRVSVALPVYNGEPYLAQTLDDLRRQSEEDWEAVICDNASTDGTPDLLAEAARQDPRIRVVRNERNVGALPNANKAIRLTTAPYISLWGHDDRHHPDFLATLAHALDMDPGAALAYPVSTLIGAEGEPFTWHPVHRVFSDAEGRIYDYDRGLECHLPADPVARFQAVLETGSIDAPIHGLFRCGPLLATPPMTIHASDRHVLAEVALRGRYVHVPEPLFGYRIHPGSTYFLDPKAWAERESGGAASSRSDWRVLASYARIPFRAALSLRQRAEAVREVGRHVLRRRWGGAEVGPGPAPTTRAGVEEWAWMKPPTSPGVRPQAHLSV